MGFVLQLAPKTKLCIALIFFFTLIVSSYLVPTKDWGLENKMFLFEDRCIFTFNTLAGIYGFVHPNLFPQTVTAKYILLFQRISGYMFRIIMLS